MKILVTGASGFVGRHLCKYLSENGDFVVALTRATSGYKSIEGADVQCACSLEDSSAIRLVLARFKPEAIIHLAAESSVSYSWKSPCNAFLNNAQIFLNTIEALRLEIPEAMFLSIGSSEQYGAVASGDIPLDENFRCNPENPYAVARVAQENLSLLYHKGFQSRVICTRSFNHIGPDQSTKFVIASFLEQAREIKRNERSAFECGDLRIIRDFVDIRDVVRAYRFLLDHGVSGQIYNVCTGLGVSLSEALSEIQRLMGLNAPVFSTENRMRPIDNPIIVGNNQKILDLGFAFNYNFFSSLVALCSSHV